MMTTKKKPRFQAFAEYFEDMASKEGKGAKVAKDNALVQIQTIMKPFVLRRLKMDVLGDLPKKVSHTVLLPMSNNTFQDVYKSVLERVLAKKNSVKNKKNILQFNKVDSKNIYSALRKAANHPLLLLRHYEKDLDRMVQESYKLNLFGHNCSFHTVKKYMYTAQTGNDYRLHLHCKEYQEESPYLKSLMLDESLLTDSPKLNWLRENLPKLWKQGHRVLLFSQWTTLLDLIEILISDLGEADRFLRLDGQTSVNDRQNMIDQFNAPNSRHRTFLLSTRAGGMGINLTSADTVVLHDLDPNPTHDKQAEDRVHRIGQTKDVTVYRLVMENTVDQHILKKSQAKEKLNTSVLQDGIPDPFADAEDDVDKSERSMASLLERALKQHGM